MATPLRILDRELLIRTLGSKCLNCGSVVDLELHHIVPIARGGLDVYTNMTLLCNTCHSKVPKPKRNPEGARKAKKPVKWLSEDEFHRICAVAKSDASAGMKTSAYSRWLTVVLMRYFRIGEIVGRGELPGIYKRDLRENGVWLIRKGYQGVPGLKQLPDAMMKLLHEYAARMEPGVKLFDLTERRMEQLMKDWALQASIPDWMLVSPHRIRAFTATHARDSGMAGPEIQQVMGHAKYATTEKYIGPMAEPLVKALRERAIEIPLDSSDAHSSDNGQSVPDGEADTRDSTA
jgi:integrase